MELIGDLIYIGLISDLIYIGLISDLIYIGLISDQIYIERMETNTRKRLAYWSSQSAQECILATRSVKVLLLLLLLLLFRSSQ